jgi:formylmethanofuran dehydrogenase subunit E
MKNKKNTIRCKKCGLLRVYVMEPDPKPGEWLCAACKEKDNKADDKEQGD